MRIRDISEETLWKINEDTFNLARKILIDPTNQEAAEHLQKIIQINESYPRLYKIYSRLIRTLFSSLQRGMSLENTTRAAFGNFMLVLNGYYNSTDIPEPDFLKDLQIPKE